MEKRDAGKRTAIIVLLVAVLCSIFCYQKPAQASAAVSAKVLTVGKSWTVKNAARVTSSRKSVAAAKKKSSAKYTVTAKKKGISTIRVYNKKGKLRKKIYLLVANGNSFKYSTSAVNLKKGGTKTAKASTNLSGVTVKYSSSKPSVAAVNSKGKITAKKAGTATVQARFYYKGIRVKTKSRKVNVYTSSYDTSALTLTAGKTKTVSASVSSNCTVKYASSDSGTVSVSSRGKITAKKAGTATVTAKVYLTGTPVKTYTKKVKVTAAGTSSGTSFSGSSSSSGSGSGSSAEYKYTYSSSKITLAGGRADSLDAYTNRASDEFEFIVVNNEKGIIELIGYEEGYCADGDRYCSIRFYGRVAGTCEIQIYRNGVLVKTVPVTVTSTDENYIGYESWRKDLEEALWTDGMGALEKIKAVGNYAFSNYPYNTSCDSAYGYYWGCGADCWGSSQLLVDVAHDLGLEAWVASPYGLSYGHMAAYVTIDGHTYTLQNSASSSDPYGFVVVSG